MELLSKEIAHWGGVRITFGGILAGLLGIILALGLAEVAARTASRILRRRGIGEGASFAVGRLVRYVVGIVAVLVTVNSVGIDLGAVLAASTVLLVGIGFGLQRIAQDFLAGVVLLLERPILKGDFVRVKDMSGTVETIGARTSRIVTRDRVTLVVPNSELTNAVVLNFSRPAEVFRLWVRFAVAYGTDMATLRRTCDLVAREDSSVLADPKAELFFEDFGDSALKFALTVCIQDPREDLRTASRIRFALAEQLRVAGIDVPFPQLDVRLRRATASSTALARGDA